MTPQPNQAAPLNPAAIPSRPHNRTQPQYRADHTTEPSRNTEPTTQPNPAAIPSRQQDRTQPQYRADNKTEPSRSTGSGHTTEPSRDPGSTRFAALATPDQEAKYHQHVCGHRLRHLRASSAIGDVSNSVAATRPSTDSSKSDSVSVTASHNSE